ncbi:nucleotidyl transferase AbiEii/AbiGii toxin family protein [Aquincola sp. S2]|uniref:Nucleotidyl transferase AbiEii/AbiGii toxin family protein n=1 Tax=Pseudaquabacterium terrae TaxID=2732868 RepID=A0ABX2EG76_9BURK|nr:nucleotidyl transferase AbiEii/AbiGii toxin family protein [Aquabacterium terrae]NRF67602.1 nucleotidyl transferase AbiEii/AbiGii toxin family protein [Aquabacterium terrae]
MFEREHHRRVASVLEALDAGQLEACHCLFGGGTAMALRFGEYRQSVDIDFLVSDREGYRRLRQLLSAADGIAAIARPGRALIQAREVRADQYGIRTMLRVADADIKFEIVLEGRITLEPPDPDDRLCGVATLIPLDMATRKLLANSDRWRDDSVLSRDLIDLAMMAPGKPLLRQAIDKAKGAYGESIEKDLAKAIADLRERPHRLNHCMRMMQMTSISKALLWSRIKALGAALPARP